MNINSSTNIEQFAGYMDTILKTSGLSNQHKRIFAFFAACDTNGMQATFDERVIADKATCLPHDVREFMELFKDSISQSTLKAGVVLFDHLKHENEYINRALKEKRSTSELLDSYFSRH